MSDTDAKKQEKENLTLKADIPDELLEAAVKSVEELEREKEKRAQEKENKETQASSELESENQKLKQQIQELQQQIRELQEKLEQTEREKNEAREKWAKISAHFENLRRQKERERQEFEKYGHKKFAKDLLDVLDSFERALSSIKDAPPSVKEGIEILYKQMLEVLQRHGIQRFDSKGQPFDYNRHEAIASVERSDLPQNTVFEEYQAGYMIYDTLLRPAKVIVSQLPPETKTQEDLPSSEEQKDNE